MKKFISVLLLTFFVGYVTGQNIIGQWNGVLKIPGKSLRVIFHIQETDGNYTATMDSPDQKTFGIPVTETSFEDNTLKINIQNKIRYDGTFENDSIKGTFKQSGLSFPLNLCKEEILIEKPQRPQEPQKPYPYYEEEVWFENPTASGVTLAGTLTLPQQEGIFPAVILVSGSGAQNRDEEFSGHKPFLVISDYLTRNGIAVLRYDDRGTASSTGIYDTCSTEDFSTDAEAAFKYLQNRKEINPKQIGFIGHSEGGIIAPMVAARNQEVASIILLSAPGIRGDSLLFLQTKLLLQTTDGLNDKKMEEILNVKRRQDSIIFHTEDVEQMKRDLTVFFEEIVDNQALSSSTQEEIDNSIHQTVQFITNKFNRFFVKYNPAPVLAQVHCPVLALNGENDIQVPADENLNAIQKILLNAGNTDITIKKLPKLNHLFQTSQIGATSEYAEIEETFSQEVLEIMLEWLKEKNEMK